MVIVEIIGMVIVMPSYGYIIVTVILMGMDLVVMVMVRIMVIIMAYKLLYCCLQIKTCDGSLVKSQKILIHLSIKTHSAQVRI